MFNELHSLPALSVFVEDHLGLVQEGLANSDRGLNLPRQVHFIHLIDFLNDLEVIYDLVVQFLLFHQIHTFLIVQLISQYEQGVGEVPETVGVIFLQNGLFLRVNLNLGWDVLNS